jgi:hypothetical protein
LVIVGQNLRCQTKFTGVVCERDVAGSLAVAGLYVQLAATAPAAFNNLIQSAAEIGVAGHVACWCTATHCTWFAKQVCQAYRAVLDVAWQ